MQMTLNQSIIINKLSIDVRVSLDPQGRVVYLPNPERKPYLITDSHRDSPVGFGIKISATKKTHIVQRRESSSGNRSKTGGKSLSEVIRSTIGNISDNREWTNGSFCRDIYKSYKLACTVDFGSLLLP